jgi:hypothetical protein
MEELRGHDILTYANGPGFVRHNTSNCTQDYWREVSDEERKDLRYRQFAGWYLEKETHAGEDVPVYSSGPHANLLSGVFEQNYIAHVICYSACIGPHATYCDDTIFQKLNTAKLSSAGTLSLTHFYFIIVVLSLLQDIILFC